MPGPSPTPTMLQQQCDTPSAMVASINSRSDHLRSKEPDQCRNLANYSEELNRLRTMESSGQVKGTSGKEFPTCMRGREHDWRG